MVCPNCPGNPPLYQRPDDNEATVMERLKVYEAQTRPLIGYYGKQGLLQVIEPVAMWMRSPSCWWVC